MKTGFQRLSDWPASAIKAGSVALVALVGLVDYLTGVDVSVTLFYLVPISLGTWFAGRSTGLLLAGASALVWLVADVLCRAVVGHPFVPIWNSVTLSLGFSVVAFLLGALKDRNEDLEQTVLERTRKLRDEIAERVRAERELKETNVALTTAREDSQRSFADLQEAHSELQRTQFRLIESAKLESVGRMAAGVAHEVKNPLMTLSLGADYFLNRHTENPAEAVLVQDMKEAIHRASNIINILLDYSRPRPLQLTSQEINRVIEDSLTLVRHQLNKGRVTVVSELRTDLPPLILDRTRIEHGLVNLFLNALNAMPEGGTLTVRTSLTTPAGNGSNSPRCVIVEVEDTGCGIAPENLSKIFEPFFTTKQPGQGTGLGLAIVRKIMDIHGGTISFHNRPEGGVRATLKFNIEPKESL
ncbi:MAG: ATP-binding protein [Verrucomicrobiota bacterium]